MTGSNASASTPPMHPPEAHTALLWRSPSAPGLVFASPVDLTGKMTQTELNATAKNWTTGCGCPIGMLALVASCLNLRNIENR
jgi:hypothetical protein